MKGTNSPQGAVGPVKWRSVSSVKRVGSTQWPSNREAVGKQRDDGDHMLQAVKFTDKKVPGSILTLTLNEDFHVGCFTEIIRRITLDVIIPSPTGLLKSGSRPCVGVAFQQSLAHDKGPAPICGPIKKANRQMFSHWEINHESLRAECYTGYRPIMFQKPRCSKTRRIVTS